jgi:hypothetical protein
MATKSATKVGVSSPAGSARVAVRGFTASMRDRRAG